MTATASYTVVGMTCSHCVSSVSEEVSHIPGVVNTDVDLATGELVVTSDSAIEDSVVRAAVEEAGYHVA